MQLSEALPRCRRADGERHRHDRVLGHRRSIGAGGIGNLAITYGYDRFDHNIMIATGARPHRHHPDRAVRRRPRRHRTDPLTPPTPPTGRNTQDRPDQSAHGLEIQLKKKKRWPWIAAAVAVVVAIAGGVSYATLANQDKPFGTKLTSPPGVPTSPPRTCCLHRHNVAPDHGITINPVKIDNLIEINRAVDAGTVARNFFEHQPFLNDAIAATGSTRRCGPDLHVGSGDDSDKYDSWQRGAPRRQDRPAQRPGRTAIALLDLAHDKQITLKPGKDTLEGLPQLSDVASNPKDYMVQVPIGQLARSLADATPSSCTSPTSTRPG